MRMQWSTSSCSPLPAQRCGNRSCGGPVCAHARLQVMLEFENSLLSVVPELKAMPYWSVSRGAADGVCCMLLQPSLPAVRARALGRHCARQGHYDTAA